MKNWMSCFVLLVLTGIPGFCDDAVFYGKGDTVFPINNNQVEMVEEEVVIKVMPESLPYMKHRYLVDCTFVFRNTGGNTDLQVGFPDYPGYSPEVPERFATIEDFKCWVNGVPVKVTFKEGLGWPLMTVYRN